MLSMSGSSNDDEFSKTIKPLEGFDKLTEGVLTKGNEVIVAY